MNKKPEELVRQNVISYLIEKLQVPKNLIRVEEPLKNYGIDFRARADLIIETPEGRALAVIECKTPNVFFDDNKSANQLLEYADALECDYCCFTNGEENFYYFYDETQGDYIAIEKLLPYSEMLQGKNSPFKIELLPKIKFGELEGKYQEYVDEWTIGDVTPKYFALPLINFFECLMDLEHKLPEGQYKIFKLVEDSGVRRLSVGTPGGSFCNYYRLFIVEYKGVEKIVSISVENYGNGKTTINVAIGYENIHHSLQLNVDNNFEIVGNRIKFFHHGRITKGFGALKIAGLRELVSKNYPQIIDGKKFYLGTLTHNRLWYLDDPEVMNVIENLISYALIRDDYRELCS